MRLGALVQAYHPESHGRNEDWPAHAWRLWADESDYMAALQKHMRRVGWFGEVPVHDGVVQDAHHRIVAALGLGWADASVPVQVLTDTD